MDKTSYGIGLTFFRVFICFIIIKNMCFYLPMADMLFGSHAIFPMQSYMQLMHGYGLGAFIYPFHLPYAPQLCVMLTLVAATCYMLAIGGRWMGLAVFALIMLLKIRNGFVLDGSDNVIQVSLPLLILADNLRHFRFFEIDRPDKPNLMTVIASVAGVALMIQIAFVYFFTSLAKLQGDLWLNGTAVYYTMRVRDFMATPFNITLTESHYFVVLSTYFTLLWEMSFPFLVWFRQTKFYILFFGVLLHLGIWVFMRIDNFSWVMMSSYFIFVTDEEYRSFYQFIMKRSAIVYIDGWCANCRRFAAFVNKLNVINLVHVRDIRSLNGSEEELKGVDYTMATMRMATVAGDKVVYGFSSIMEIVKRLPLLWLLLPIMYILKAVRVGDAVYGELAIKRQIIPIHCSESCSDKIDK
ncbi:MAG TPA: HTTM domain-containing protein [Chryseosolibacter sp.]|nr:HTTM domain-containing protein [Chryseosolibacter sp.]